VDYFSQRYFTIANRLARELRRAAIALESVSSRIQHQIESSARQPEPTRNEIHFLPEDLNRYYGEQNKSYRLQRSTFLVGVVTLITLGIAARYTYRQWRTMENTYDDIHEQTAFAQRTAKAASDSAGAAIQANDDARKRFQQDERPYVWIKNGLPGEGPFFNAAKGQIGFNFGYTNYGKSLADKLVFDTFSMRVGANTPFRNSVGFPGKGKAKVGYPLAPTQLDFNTAFSEPGIDQKTYNSLLTVDDALAIRVTIKYADLAGNQYETGICIGRLANGILHPCEGTYIH